MSLRRFPIQPNPHSLQLRLQKRPLLRLLRSIQNHENQIARLRRTDNLPTSPLPLGSPLNNPWQIQDLDLSAAVLEDSRDSGQGREGVGCYFGLGLGDFGEEGRFSHRGEADQCDSRVPGFRDVEAGASPTTGARAGFEELGSVAGELSDCCVNI